MKRMLQKAVLDVLYPKSSSGSICPGRDKHERRQCKVGVATAHPSISHSLDKYYTSVLPHHGDFVNKAISGTAAVGCTVAGGPVLGIKCALVAEAFDSYIRDHLEMAAKAAKTSNPAGFAHEFGRRLLRRT